MTNKKTLRDLVFPNKKHKEVEESKKINYASKTIIRIIIFYLVETILLIKIRDYQFIRNVSEIGKKSTVSIETIESLRNLMIIENLGIVVLTSFISIGLLYYCNKKMSEI